MNRFSNACPVVLIALLTLSGCATPTEYRADSSHPVRTITISKTVPVPKDMLFVGLSESLGMGLGGGIAGAVGAGIVAGTTFSRPGSEKFDLGQSVRSEFVTAIQKSGKFTIKPSGPADAELQLKVTGYGFYSAGLFARRVRPILGVEAKLVRPDGTVVWQHRRAISQMTGRTPGVLPEKIRDDPKVGADALRVAARICAEAAVRSLRQ